MPDASRMQKRNVVTDDWIELKSGALTAAINPLGAELSSLTDREGRELMTDADPRWWTGRAPLLFPIVGRLAGDSYELDHRTYEMAQHGFARRRKFALVERTSGSLVLELAADDETRAIYPFDFRLTASFRLSDARLDITITVANEGDRAMPFSFGFHPAFAWPLPFGSPADRHHILFDEDEAADIRRTATGTGLIAATTEASPVAGRKLVPDAAMFERDALIWDRLNSRGLLWGVAGEPNIRLEFPDTPWLGLWQKPGARYLCIEPWAGMADPLGFSGEIWDKPGIMRLAPAARRAFRLGIALTS